MGLVLGPPNVEVETMELALPWKDGMVSRGGAAAAAEEAAEAQNDARCIVKYNATSEMTSKSERIVIAAMEIFVVKAMLFESVCVFADEKGEVGAVVGETVPPPVSVLGMAFPIK